MRNIELDDRIGHQDGTAEGCISWDCTVCGRARLCPYASPCLSDRREACRSCGDLLARIGNSTARAAVSTLEVW